MELALTATARKDDLFGQDVTELVARLRQLEQAAGGAVAAGPGSAVFTGSTSVRASGGGIALGPVAGDVHITQGPAGLPRTASQIDGSDKIALASGQLGSDQPAIRVGAVHALAEIATAVPRERSRVAQILSAHLRSEAPAPGPDGDGAYLLPALQVRLPVAQAIVSVLTSGLFPGLDLSHADLCGASLANCVLSGADLRKVNLRCADLRRADLKGADLRQADLTGAKLAGALLAGAKVTDARLAEMDLTGVDLSEVELIRVDMSRSMLAGVDWSGRNDLYYARFRYADLTGANLAGAELRGTQFDGAKLRDADLSQARMVRASLEGASLEGTRMRYADLAKADLTHADLRNTDLRGAMLQQANLTGAFLSGTDLRGASLVDADLSHITHMHDVRIDRRTREEESCATGHLLKSSWTSPQKTANAVTDRISGEDIKGLWGAKLRP